MTKQLWILVGLVILSAGPAAAGDFCRDPRLPTPAGAGNRFFSNGGGCRSFSIGYREDGVLRTAIMAEVVTGMSRDRDFISPQITTFLRKPDGDIVNLGEKYIGTPAVDWFVAESLGIDRPCCYSSDVFYKPPVIERIESEYCLTYKMKQPFRGSFHDCSSHWAEPSGMISYGDGITSWRQAMQLACAKYSADTGRPCDGPYDGVIFNVVRRSPKGALYYVIDLRGCLGKESECASGEYDHLLYRVAAKGGDIRLLQQTKDEPDPQQWMGFKKAQ